MHVPLETHGASRLQAHNMLIQTNWREGKRQSDQNTKTERHQKSTKKCRRRKEAGGGGKRLSLASPSCTTMTTSLGSPIVTTNAIMTSSAASSTNYQQLPNSTNNYSSTPPPSLSPIPHRFWQNFKNGRIPSQSYWLWWRLSVMLLVMLNVPGTEVGFPPFSQGKCLNSPQATSTARSVLPWKSPCSTLSLSVQITQPAFLKPLYFEVPKTSPSPLVGRSWLFREVELWHEITNHIKINFKWPS